MTSTDEPDDSAVADAAVDLTEALVRLDTVNPGLVPGAAGERAAAGSCRLGWPQRASSVS